MTARKVSFLIVLTIALTLVATGSRAQETTGTTPAASSANSASAPSQQSSSGSDRVVLKVGNLQVTEGEFESRINDIEGGDPDKKAPGDKERRKLGDDYASVLMLSQQAVANHLDSSPEVIRQLAIARMQVLSDAEFASLMRQAEPSSAEVEQYYSAHLADYDQVQIRRLFIWKQRDNSKDTSALTTQAARARADRIRQGQGSHAHSAGGAFY